MSKKNKALPAAGEIIQTKSCKGRKFVKFLVIAGIGAAAVYQIRGFIKRQNEALNAEDFQGDTYITRFSGKEIRIDEGRNAPNMRLINQFSGVSVDLSKALIAEDINIKIQNSFSGLAIRIPEGINVKADCAGKGSGISIPDRSYEGAPTIYVSGANNFSGLSVYTKPEEDVKSGE